MFEDEVHPLDRWGGGNGNGNDRASTGMPACCVETLTEGGVLLCP